MTDKKRTPGDHSLISSGKTVPAIGSISELTRDGLPKAYLPKFFYKPPFGYPRFLDLPNIRRLGATPFVDMCTTTITDEISAVPWDIVTDDESEDISPQKQAQIDHVRSFFDNPNTNKDSWEMITRVFVRDILEIDSGIITKIFNRMGQMVEIKAMDGSTFTKNPDLHGFITSRDDIIFDSNIMDTPGSFTTPESQKLLESARAMEPGWITAADVREKAAYFQYGWITGARPVPFGKKEIVWFERNPRSDSIYGRGVIEILVDTIQTLIYAIEHNLDYFRDNSIPVGLLGLEGSDAEEITAFKDQWEEQQRIRDTAGNWKKVFHKLPIVNKLPKFERLGFTNLELQLIEGQKWWAKMVWACFGVTPTELGYTEDAKGMANQIVQSNVFRKRAINPLLRMIEYKVNTEIVSEFGYEGIKFKYQMFDVEEETKKSNLFKLQIESGIRTVNEIRQAEGFDPVDWGDKPPKQWSAVGGNNFNFGNPNGNSDNPFNQEQGRREEESEDSNKKKKDEEEEEKKDIETKPFAGYRNFADCVRKNQDKKNPEAYCATIMRKVEGKADNPLVPKENEQMNEEKLKSSIIFLMDQNKENIKAMITKEMGQEKLSEIKSVDDIAKAIDRVVTFLGLKRVSDAVIRHTFMGGWDKAEKQMDRNFMVDMDAIEYIQDYTFNNIKDMTDEIKSDLRAELERGIMAGEGISNIKARVDKVFKVGENRAEMIARTEINRSMNQGKLRAMKQSEEEVKKFLIITYDKRTSEISKAMGRKYGTSKQAIPLDDNFSVIVNGKEISGPAPPFHVNERDAIVFTME